MTHIVRYFIEAGALLVIAVELVVFALLAVPLARWLKLGRWATFAGLASIAPILSVTLLRPDSWADYASVAGHLSGRGLFTWWRQNWGSSIKPDSTQWQANLVLFIPAGFVWGFITRRLRAMLLGVAVGTLAVEMLQSITGIGAPDTRDLVANSLGGWFGAGCGVALGSFVYQHRRRDSTLTNAQLRRRSTLMLSALIVVATIAFISARVGADHRRAALRHRLEVAFAGSTNPIEGYSQLQQEQIFADYFQRQIPDTDVTEANFVVTYLGLDRCVYIRWSSAGVTFHNGAGGGCTGYRDSLND